MSSAFRVEWSDAALDGWKRLSLQDARRIAMAVMAFAERGEGTVIYVDGEFLLLVDGRVVVMLIDGDTIYVDRIRRAAR